MKGIEKSFPGVLALSGVDLDLKKGEVLAVVGENGAGKSTLIKVLAGAHRPNKGTIELNQESVEFQSPLDAIRAGIGVIYQEFNLVPHLTVRENVFLGHEAAQAGFVKAADEREACAALLARLESDIDPEERVSTLSVAQQQITEIAKALSLGAQIIVMDEPSAALTNQEVDRLFEIVRDLRRDGISVIYISHRLEEVFELADRVLVLRDGELVETRATEELNREELIELMVGRPLDQEFPSREHRVGEVRLDVRGLTRLPSVQDATFQVRSGEILGLTGLVGAGRTELARPIFGADLATSGSVLLDGQQLSIRTPLDAIKSGICLLTEDRKNQGLILKLSVRDNFSLPNLGHWSRAGFIRGGAERKSFSGYVESLRIKIPNQSELARNLSGGNQQKVLLARWLESHSDVIIFDEPTRGIDVGAKYEIYLLMNELAAAGKAIIMISSELPEVLGMSDRILVMHQGKINGEIVDVPNATQEMIMNLATSSSTIQSAA